MDRKFISHSARFMYETYCLNRKPRDVLNDFGRESDHMADYYLKDFRHTIILAFNRYKKWLHRKGDLHLYFALEELTVLKEIIEK